MPSIRPIAIDLFAGAGGMTLGFEQAGFDVVAAVEIDPIHCATYEYNFPFWPIICRSIKDISGAEIRAISGIGGRQIDVVFGGPPCQGFSIIGKRAGNDPRNFLVFEFIRLIDELRPKFFVLENVKGMVNKKSQHLLSKVIEKLQECGYKIEENYQILNAACYGVPQNRERLFLLGCRWDFDLPNYPQPTTRPARTTSKKFNSSVPNSPTVEDAIEDLPDTLDYPELSQRDWIQIKLGNPSSYAKKLRGEAKFDHDYSYVRVYQSHILTSSMTTEHTPQTIERFKRLKAGEIDQISRLVKLDPCGISPTLRAGTPRNRGSFTSPRPIHPRQPRCITVREAARLHSYPDWFRFHHTKWHGFRQVGNSVPPLLAKAVAAEIVQALNIKLPFCQEDKALGSEKLLYLKLQSAAQYYGVNPNVIAARTRKKL